ncbi:hypothetical protein PAHAL_9G158700 [Panicum hallii]|uniref:Uncharacterized protein n=1 Tax=Panicum hallii TaxID=206008 RepID=A0A2T8I1C8_9POAL|nr:hypothetical protein PAHAL_9G158700 [Panicum hallii]
MICKTQQSIQALTNCQLDLPASRSEEPLPSSLHADYGAPDGDLEAAAIATARLLSGTAGSKSAAAVVASSSGGARGTGTSTRPARRFDEYIWPRSHHPAGRRRHRSEQAAASPEPPNHRAHRPASVARAPDEVTRKTPPRCFQSRPHTSHRTDARLAGAPPHSAVPSFHLLRRERSLALLHLATATLVHLLLRCNRRWRRGRPRTGAGRGAARRQAWRAHNAPRSLKTPAPLRHSIHLPYDPAGDAPPLVPAVSSRLHEQGSPCEATRGHVCPPL